LKQKQKRFQGFALAGKAWDERGRYDWLLLWVIRWK